MNDAIFLDIEDVPLIHIAQNQPFTDHESGRQKSASQAPEDGFG